MPIDLGDVGGSRVEARPFRTRKGESTRNNIPNRLQGIRPSQDIELEALLQDRNSRRRGQVNRNNNRAQFIPVQGRSELSDVNLVDDKVSEIFISIPKQF